LISEICKVENRAQSHWREFVTTKGVVSLQACVEDWRKLTMLYSSDRPEYLTHCSNLSVALYNLFQLTGASDLALFAEALEKDREVYTTRSVSHHDRPRLCGHLGSLLSALFSRTGDLTLLNEVIIVCREAVSTLPESHSHLSKLWESLLNALIARIMHTGDFHALAEIVGLERQILLSRPLGHPDRGMTGYRLFAFLKNNPFRQAIDLGPLDDVIRCEREAMISQTLDHPNRAALGSTLGEMIMLRHLLTGSEIDLEDAAEVYRGLLRHDHPDSGRTCIRLANVLIIRADNRFGDPEVLNEAVGVSREALRLWHEGHPNHGAACSTLGGVLFKHFRQTGDPSLLEESIALNRRALQIWPSAAIFETLRDLLVTRYDTSDRIADLDEAIQFARKAITLRSPSPDLCTTNREKLCTLLAKKSATATDKLPLLSEAVDLLKDVLQSQSAEDGNRSPRPEPFASLALALSMHSEQTKDAAQLTEIQSLSAHAFVLLDERPKDWTTCINITHLQFRHMDSFGSFRVVVQCLERALSSSLNNLPRFLRAASSMFQLMTEIHIPAEFWEPILEICSAAVDLIPLAAGPSLEPSTRLHYLSSCRALGLVAYELAIVMGDFCRGIQLLERTRGIIWSQMLHLLNPELDDPRLPPPLVEEIRSLLSQLELGFISKTDATGINAGQPPMHSDFPSGGEVQPQLDRQQKHSRVQQLLREVRLLPGLSSFMRSLPFEQLMATSTSHPVVVLIAGASVCQALILQASSNRHMFIPFTDIYPGSLQEFSFSSSHMQMRGQKPEGGHDVSESATRLGVKFAKRQSAAHLRLGKLWRVIVKPIIQALGLEVRAALRTLVQTLTAHEEGHWVRSTAPTLVSDGNIHVCSPTRSWDIRRTRSRIVLRLRGLVLHPDADGARSRTRQIASSRHTAAEACPHRLEQHQDRWAASSVESQKRSRVHCGPREGRPGYGRHAEFVRRRYGVSGDRSSSVVPSRPHRLSRHTEHGRASEEQLLPQRSSLDCDGVDESEPEERLLRVPECLRDGQGRPGPARPIRPPGRHDAVHWFPECCGHHVVSRQDKDAVPAMLTTNRAMQDRDGPEIARRFYSRLFEKDTVDADSIPYALDGAVRELRESGASPERWATFIHLGA
jgi:tetratricopeptide (TPR) repeat protein